MQDPKLRECPYHFPPGIALRPAGQILPAPQIGELGTLTAKVFVRAIQFETAVVNDCVALRTMSQLLLAYSKSRWIK